MALQADLVLEIGFPDRYASDRDPADPAQRTGKHPRPGTERRGSRRVRVVAVNAGDMARHRHRIFSRIVDPLPALDLMTRWLEEFDFNILLGKHAVVADGAVLLLDGLREQKLRMRRGMDPMAALARVFSHGRVAVGGPWSGGFAAVPGLRRSRMAGTTPVVVAMAHRAIGAEEIIDAQEVGAIQVWIVARSALESFLVVQRRGLRQGHGIDEVTRPDRERAVVNERDWMVVGEVSPERGCAAERGHRRDRAADGRHAHVAQRQNSVVA